MRRKEKKHVDRANMHKQIELIREKNQTLFLALGFNMTLRVHNLLQEQFGKQKNGILVRMYKKD